MTAASRAADNIWDFGVLKKGYGLCHGITGNAYPFLKLHNYGHKFPDKDYYKRAVAFLLTKLDSGIQYQIKNFDLDYRKVVGISDHPFSIMMGLAGDLCYEMDLIFPQLSE